MVTGLSVRPLDRDLTSWGRQGLSNRVIRTSFFALLTAAMASGSVAQDSSGRGHAALEQMSDAKLDWLAPLTRWVEGSGAEPGDQQQIAKLFSQLAGGLEEGAPDPGDGGGTPRYLSDIFNAAGPQPEDMDAEGGNRPDIAKLISLVKQLVGDAPDLAGDQANPRYLDDVLYAGLPGGRGVDSANPSLDPLRQLIQEILDGHGGGQPPVNPAHFPYIDGYVYSPIPVTVQGTYRGVVEGLTSSNADLSGTARFDIDARGFDVNISGQFDFGSRGVVNIVQESVNGPLGFHHGNPSFLGGTITSTDHTNFDFYGPQAQEFGGHWGFVVTGGSEPGLVSGMVKTAR